MGGFLDDVADAVDIDVPIGLLRDIGRPIEGGDVLHHLDAIERTLEALPVQEIARYQLEVWMREVGRTVRRPVHAPRGHAFLGQVLAQPGPCEPIRARDENLP